MMNMFKCATGALSVLAVTLLTAVPSYGDMRLDKIIVDFDDGKTRRTDIEVTNGGKAPIYVSVKPAEIVRPGRKDQKRRQHRDPKKMGMKIAPAAGRTVAMKTGLRVLVGYDVLVIARPDNAKPAITGERSGRRLTLRNTGNTNALLVSGKQCNKAGKCVDLPTTRLYAGITWTVDLPLDAPAEYRLQSGDVIHSQTF
jgi:hypothetical protein